MAQVAKIDAAQAMKMGNKLPHVAGSEGKMVCLLNYDCVIIYHILNEEHYRNLNYSCLV